MKVYEKPIVLMNEELSEGVYAASGGASSSAGAVVAGGSATAWLDSCDHYGNFYFKISGIENGATYRIVVTVTETEKINGLTSASWGDIGAVVSGNTVTINSITLYANQTDWHVRFWFDSFDWNWGWQLQDADIPGFAVSITKIG